MRSKLADVYVSAGGNARVVTCRLAGKRELADLAKWKQQTKTADADANDALEFAKLSSKRWSFYTAEKRAISSLETARSRAEKDKMGEQAFLIVLTAAWTPYRVLGLCLFRRSWCNHLIVDFIASHPANWAQPDTEVRGILRALFYGVTEVASSLHVKRIWGEATDSSAPKYKHLFQLDTVDDLFLIQTPQWRAFRKQVRLAPR